MLLYIICNNNRKIKKMKSVFINNSKGKNRLPFSKFSVTH